MLRKQSRLFSRKCTVKIHEGMVNNALKNYFSLKTDYYFLTGEWGWKIFHMQTLFICRSFCKQFLCLRFPANTFFYLHTIHFSVYNFCKQFISKFSNPPPPPSKKEWSVPYIFWLARRKRKSSAADNRFERISRGVRSDDNFFQADSPSLWNGWRFFPTDRPSRSNDNNFYWTSHSNGRTFLFGTDSQSCSKKYQIFETKAFHYYR